MRSRIKAKKNKKIIYDNVFNPLKKSGFELSYIKFTYGYYLFNLGKNNVAYFGLKQIPEINFGIWHINNELKIFGDIIGYIDKFKPSCASLTFDNVNELISFINEFIHTYTDSLADLIRRKMIDKNEKNKPSDVIISEYKEMIEKEKILSRNHGLTNDEMKTCKILANEFINYCFSIDIPLFYEIKTSMYYKVFAVYHLFIDQRHETNYTFLNKVSNLRNNFFLIKLHPNKKKLKKITRNVAKKNKKNLIKII